MNCPKCHKPNVENAKFCSHCGEPLQTKKTIVYDNCTNCGAKLAPDKTHGNGAAVTVAQVQQVECKSTDAPIPLPLQAATTMVIENLF